MSFDFVYKSIYSLERSEIDKLLDQTELLNRLVDELRELWLAEARQLPLQQTAFDLNELMSLIVETFQPTVQKRGLSLDLRLPSEIIRFTGDRGRIQQVLNNLIQNAITHTPPGGKVHLTLSQDQGHIHLMVQDTGEGIPARHLPHVFDRFYRVDYSRSRETGGTGLGLAIAKAIIELHDGEIQVMSDGLLGSGSTFTISLPRSER